MTKCKKCGEQLQPGDVYCGNCGAHIATEPSRPPKPKKSRKLLMASLATLAAASIVFLLASPLILPASSCSTPPGYSKYSAPNPYFGFAYPSSWDVNYSAQATISQEVVAWSQPKDLQMVAGSDKGYSLAKEKASDEQYYNLTSGVVANATHQLTTVAGINASLYTYRYHCGLGTCTLSMYIFLQNGYAFFSMFATSSPATYSTAIGKVMDTFSLQSGCP